MKYPLTQEQFTEYINHIVEHNKSLMTPTVPMVYQNITDVKINQKLNGVEEDFGGEMSPSEIAQLFGEQTPSSKVNGVDMSIKDPFHGMTLDEINEWEKTVEESNNIYKIKARLQNHWGGELTPAGEALLNTFAHIFKDLYTFAGTIYEKEIRNSLVERIKKHEKAPAGLIATTARG